jgi:hypothetical protein
MVVLYNLAIGGRCQRDLSMSPEPVSIRLVCYFGCTVRGNGPDDGQWDDTTPDAFQSHCEK